MKQWVAALAAFGLLLGWTLNADADRLYTWTDAKGRTHITQDPPPETAKVIDTIDYAPQPEPPVRRPAASDRPERRAVNVNPGGGPAGRSSDTTGFTYDNPEDDADYQYIGGPYRQTLRQYERRGEVLDRNNAGEGGDQPPIVRPRPRPRMR